MKKIFLILFVLSLLFLTSCSNTKTPETSTENIETTSHMESTETSQKIESTSVSQTTETSSSDNTIPNLPTKSESVVLGKVGKFTDMKSRILFQQKVSGNNRLVYYSKADGETYVFCFDPLCEHKSGCSSLPGIVYQMSYCENDNRFYLTDRFQLSSFSFDGIDNQKSFLEGIDKSIRLEDTKAYKQYIYISALLPTEEKHQIRYDTDMKKTIDLTEKTGLYSKISYFYDGYIYGIWQYPDPENPESIIYQYGRTDLNFENFEALEAPSFNYLFAEGQDLIGVFEGDIIIYNVETAKQTVVSKDTIGCEVTYLLGADENYFYFVNHSTPVYFESPTKTILNMSGGKLYRINRDGTGLMCIYENENFDIIRTDICIYEDVILISGKQIGFQASNTIPSSWDEGVYIGKINEDGTIDSLEWVEVIA
ncbi:MAG: hypothetical protein IJ489_05150 [Clostridia bacterium]|nr:hypothetical protein [Clostridia bacterium]